MKLRDYQIECVKTIHSVKNGEKKLVQSATGSGKTIILSQVASDSLGRVLIVVPSTELREQTEEKLRMIDPVMDIGHVQGSLNESSNKVVIATRQSLTHVKSKRIGDMIKYGKFDYLIFDEAHQAPKQIHKILKQVNRDVKTIGFTATPYTRDCIETFGQPIFRRTIIDMIDKEFLVEPYAILVQSKTNISHVKTSNGDFAQGELEQAVNNEERNQLIIESYKKYAAERTLTLVFAAGREHGKELYKEFNEYGITAEYIDGETPKEKRKEIINNFKSKTFKVLINVMTLTTGFDVPETDCIMICRPSKSRILYEQIVGRGLRLADGKTDCQIIDIQDITKKHDLMDVSVVFNTPMKHGERLRDAKKRLEEERLAAEKKKQEEEIKRIERERVKQQELEIIAQRIKLINRDMKQGFENRKYDWFRVDANSYALGYGFNNYYVIESVNDRFIVYDTSTDKEQKFISQMCEFENVIDAIASVEKTSKLNTYSDPRSEWKNDPPTDGQLKFCGWAKSKWEVSRYFAASSISSLISKNKKASVI